MFFPGKTLWKFVVYKPVLQEKNRVIQNENYPCVSQRSAFSSIKRVFSALLKNICMFELYQNLFYFEQSVLRCLNSSDGKFGDKTKCLHKKKFNSHRSGLGLQHGGVYISNLSWENNMRNYEKGL